MIRPLTTDLLAACTERFWSKVQKTGGCWLWTAGRFSKGYGAFSLGNKNYHAQRVAWLLAGRTIPEGEGILHACDNPRCVRLDHLFTGTSTVNNQDRAVKGRSATGDRSGARKHPERQVRGERQGLAKLTAAAVVEIRRRYAVGESQLKIGHAFGVSHRAVGYVVNGQTWRHIL